MKQTTSQSGFTLVELAIAMVVIGLIMVGILKGNELIENSKINGVVRQVRLYESATSLFREAYGALPGDIENPESRINNCASDLCAQGGNGNGRIYDTTTSDHEREQYNYFPHLSKAGYIQEPVGGTVAQMAAADPKPFFPRLPLKVNPNDGVPYIRMVYVTSGSTFERGVAWNATQAFHVAARLSAITAEMLDRKIDDGKPVQGRMRVSTSGCTVSGSWYDNATYLLTGAGWCSFWIKVDF